MEPGTKLSFIKCFPLFESLTERELAQLSQMIEYRTRTRNGFIYRSGDVSNAVYFLVKGSVKISTHSSDGREIIKAILQPMAMFGELSVVGEHFRQDTARAMNEEVQYAVLKVEDFQQLIASNNQLCQRLLALLGGRLLVAERRLESLVFKDARTRIIEFLKESANDRGRKIGYEMLVKHSLTQQDIANLTGTSRQTVTSVLNELKKLDLIYFNRKSILIRDLGKLC